MKTRRIAIVTLVLACASGCVREDAGSSGLADVVPEWKLASQPMLQIGVVSGEDVYQLHNVVGAVRLPDGRIAVANDGTKEIRFFGNDGRFLRAWGQAGNGPEEVRRIYALDTLGDTLIVVDGTRRRFVYLTPDGAFVRGDPWPEGELFPGTDWMLWRTIVRSPMPTGRRGVVEAVLSQLEVPDGPGYRYARVSDDGQLWSAVLVEGSRPRDSVRWEIRDLTGQLTARLSTSPHFRPFDSGPGWLLGVWQDSLEVQYVRLYEVEGSSDGPARSLAEAADAFGGAEPDFTPVTGDAVGATRALLRNMASLQELFYSSHMTYSRLLDSLGAGGAPVELPEGLELAILSASSSGWIAQTREASSGTTCVMNLMVQGWLRITSPAGTVGCWRARPAAPPAR